MNRLLQISLAVATVLGAAIPAAQAQNAEAGSKKVAMCFGCHGIIGYQASFPEIHKVPMLEGQNAKYIAAALGAYAKGERKHPTMNGIAKSLSEQDIADISAFYAERAKAPAVPAEAPAAKADVAKLLEKGACFSCHGKNFSTPLTGAEPKLAGQHADYLYVALKSYQTEGNPMVGRGNAVMAAQVKQFKLEELKEIAAYLGSLPSELRTTPESRFR
ncbi:cytochrome c [Pelomonas sp. KK5]|uniref:c-type cytochrome n=1 Tax=Pelomonas sp. KK5 TaxID=1855730 RepID=UPI00097CB80C|nr:c-type cytochrome [Pelomonas sp. KK5]